MAKLSQSQKVVRFLKTHPNQKFTARQIAKAITTTYANDYLEKRNNPRFSDEKAFITQIIAEIGAQKDQILKNDHHIFWQDKPRPRVYWYNPKKMLDNTLVICDDDTKSEMSNHMLSEETLYPLLTNYLNSELHLYCQRIDEKRSKNSRGNGGNQWLHPDIVAMQTIDEQWHDLIRHCVKNGAGQRVRLWSFEVKKELNSSNIRKSFFQTVSNSSWANEGYLVTTDIADANTEKELRMLSTLHGIGIILLNANNPSESEIMIPSRSKPEVDWESANRILLENEDFKDYIELVSIYYQTARIREKDWNKM